MKVKHRKAMEEFLDYRYQYALDRDAEMGNKDGDQFLENNPDYIYYKGAIKMLEHAGIDWRRNGSHHTLFV